MDLLLSFNLPVLSISNYVVEGIYLFHYDSPGSSVLLHLVKQSA